MKKQRRNRSDEEVFDLLGPGVDAMSLAIPAVASLFIGMAIGGVLRTTSAAWTMPAVGLPVCLLAGAFDALAGACVGIATFGALATGLSDSLHKRQKGGEMRRRELERIGLLRFGRRLIGTRSALSNRVRDVKLALGSGSSGIAWVSLGTQNNGVHCFVPGKTGSGKTVTAATLLAAQIHSDAAVIAIDPKDDGELSETLRAAARSAGVPFVEIEPGRSSVGYNVALYGGNSEVAEKILSAHEWSEPHYRSIAQRFAQTTVGVLRECGVSVSLKTVGHYMHPDRLEALAAKTGIGGEQVASLIGDLPRRMVDDLAGARSRIAVLADSDHGRWLDPDQVRPVDLDAALKSRAVVVFRLDSAGHPELTKLLAASLVLDVISLSGRMRSTPHRAAVFLDEFAELAADQVSRLLATGRSAGVSVLLAAQSLADLEAARGDRTLIEQVIGNCDYCIAHQTPDPTSAELLAGLTGTYATWTQTEAYSMTPLSAPQARSKIPTREYNVHPDVFKELVTGEAVIIPRRGGEVAQRIKVWSSRLRPIVRAQRGEGGGRNG